ncbi:MAG TPA: DUF1287 domain-containing protein [Thiolinea sp.]|nr:DUF1287 domain-containing protein [Thiolinea sp.]
MSKNSSINNFDVICWSILIFGSLMSSGCSVAPAGKAETKPAAVAVSGVDGKTAGTRADTRPEPAKRSADIAAANRTDVKKTAQSGAAARSNYHDEFDKKRLQYNLAWERNQEVQRRKQAYVQSWEQQQQVQQRSAPIVAVPPSQSAAQVAATNIPHYSGTNIQNDAGSGVPHWGQQQVSRSPQPQYAVRHAFPQNPNLSGNLVRAALDRTRYNVRYDGRYLPIGYPNGDVPQSIGVCTDTVIRSYRRLGIDLQQLVHEDMSQSFYVYPNLPKWGLSGPDPNIDHRRVHNLKVFFTRYGQRLPVTHNALNYRPGDLVTWSLGGDQEHIGVVVDRISPEDPSRYMIVHNVGEGEKLEDVLFKWPITGHFRYLPAYQSGPQLASAR